MPSTTRQTSLLAAEDWKKIYQTFKDADFQSYDFETIRKSMIDYLRLYFPEDFNDYIESSEFIALIDLIAFMGQSLAYRGDLNARENFIDTAERRDSILRLARLVSYSSKRNTPASGILKISNISSTEQLFDSNGIDLTNTQITFNDSTNPNWLEQFTIILNASLQSSQKIGKPANRNVINGITTDEYSLNLLAGVSPTFGYTSQVEGTTLPFEITTVTSAGKEFLFELTPRAGQNFNILNRNDNLGNASNNTGFFMFFKQGTLKSVDFEVSDAIPNRIVSLNFANINNTDIWLYSLDDNNDPEIEWTEVPAITGNNIAFNNVSSTDRQLFQVITKANDTVDIAFGDGVFAEIPRGKFRVYFRQSNGLQYKITPDEMADVTIPITYVSRRNRVETLTITASLKFTVANASARETSEEIKQKAPQQFYTQNRMVNGEDYNIFPFTKFSNIIKSKAVNRTSSGISRFLDVVDTTGKFSSTNIFAEDGLFYRDEFIKSFTFDFINSNDILTVINNQVESIISSEEMLHFFFANYARFTQADVQWHQTTINTNKSTGFFQNAATSPQPVGPTAITNLKHIIPGSIVKFTAPANNFFDINNKIKPGLPKLSGERTEIYTLVISVVNDGTAQGLGDLESGLGPVTLSDIIPQDAIMSQIITSFSNNLPAEIEQEIIDNVLVFDEFGLRFDINAQEWSLIKSEDLDKTSPFSTQFEGDISGSGLDSSWLLTFENDGETYTVKHRGLDYIFESVLETRFYFDPDLTIFDSRTGLVIHDRINMLKVNAKPDSSDALGSDIVAFIHDNIVESDGFENNRKVKVTFADEDSDGSPDDPDFFERMIAPTVDSQNKFVFFKRTTDFGNFNVFAPIDNRTVEADFFTQVLINAQIIEYLDGQIFYAKDEDKFFVLTVTATSRSIAESTEFIARVGRQDIFFQYRHNSPNDRRIDPSPNNIIDLFLLTRQYDTDFKEFIGDVTGTLTEPVAPTGDELRSEFNSLEEFSVISDTLIYNSAVFKPLFGSQADPSLQAVFKVVKNENVNISDSEVKTKLITSLNTFFDTVNWDFGETFFFSELSAFLHQELVPDVSSIVIVPLSNDQSFGSLYQVNAEPHEIIVNAATVDDVQIISSITAAQIKAIPGSVL